MVARQLSTPARNLLNRFFGYDVFISYSRSQSTAYAASLQEELKKVGLACFIDQREIHPGAVLDSTIREGIRRSGAIVPIITKGADQSFYVMNEIAEGVRAVKQIIPISVDDEIRAVAWHEVQQYRWIDESAVAVETGIVSNGIAEEIRQSFAAMRRTQFRRLTIAAIALIVLAISALAYAGFRDARVQEAFGLY